MGGAPFLWGGKGADCRLVTGSNTQRKPRVYTWLKKKGEYEGEGISLLLFVRMGRKTKSFSSLFPGHYSFPFDLFLWAHCSYCCHLWLLSPFQWGNCFASSLASLYQCTSQKRHNQEETKDFSRIVPSVTSSDYFSLVLNPSKQTNRSSFSSSLHLFLDKCRYLLTAASKKFYLVPFPIYIYCFPILLLKNKTKHGLLVSGPCFLLHHAILFLLLLKVHYLVHIHDFLELDLFSALKIHTTQCLRNLIINLISK